MKAERQNLLEAVAPLETVAVFPTGKAFSCRTSVSFPSRACESCALGCGHSALEEVQAQGSHKLSGQATPVLHDPHRDFVFFRHSSSLNLSSFRRRHCLSASHEAVLGRACPQPLDAFPIGTGVCCDVPRRLLCSMLNRPQPHTPSLPPSSPSGLSTCLRDPKEDVAPG